MTYFVMCRTAIEPVQQGPRLWRYHCNFVVLPGKDSHGLERVEPHDGDELGKILILPTQQLDTAVSGDSALRNPVEDL